jgi:hypothetical protein
VNLEHTQTWWEAWRPAGVDGACAAQEESKKLRQKQKDKVQPKMGKLDIDYQARRPALGPACAPCSALSRARGAQRPVRQSRCPESLERRSRIDCGLVVVVWPGSANRARVLAAPGPPDLRAPLPLPGVTRSGAARGQVLHDAFFKHQTKPSLTPMGALYYEGREFEARVRARRGRARTPRRRLRHAAVPTHAGRAAKLS